mgnify:CR=1 FL=1
MRKLIKWIIAGLVLLNTHLFANPTHFWPFYGNADGAVSIDATLTADRFNNPDYAYEFDGVSSYIEYADDPSLDITGQISIETWVYLDSSASNTNHTILVKAESTSNVDIPNTYSLGTSGDSTYRFCVGGHEILFGTVAQEEWTHITVTFNHAFQRAKCYLNGDLVLERPALLNNIQTSDYSLIVGSAPEHNNNWYGVIDDIRLFDRVITEAEVDSLYTLTYGPHILIDPPRELIFDNIYIGYPDTLNLIVSNSGLGLDSLTISEQIYTGSVFEMDLTPYSLQSGESRILPVIFNPSMPGYYSDSFQILNNDPSSPIYNLLLICGAVYPPEISVSLTMIQDTLYTGGIAEYSITIDNSAGLGDLEWSIEFLNDLNADTIYFEKLPWTDWTLPESQDSISETVSLAREIDYYGLLNATMETEYDDLYSPLGTLWGMGRSIDVPVEDYRYWKYWLQEPPTIVVDTVMSLKLTDSNQYYDLLFDTWLPPEHGAGYSYYRIEAPSFTNNASQTSGVVGAGSNTNLTLTIDAFKSQSSNYNSYIQITSNDIDEPIVLLPINIDIIEAPDIYTEEDSVDFGQSFIGFTDSVVIEVFNKGYGLLNVLGVQTPPGPFTITPSQIEIPENAGATFTLTFIPTSEIDFSGNLIFVTNDPDESSFQLPFIANGVNPPVLEIDTETIVEEINQGDTLEVGLQFQNDGGSNLLYEVFPFTSVYDTMILNTNAIQDHSPIPGKYRKLLYSDANDADSVSLDLKSISFTISKDTIEFIITTYTAIESYWSFGVLIDRDRRINTGWHSPTHWPMGSDNYVVIEPLSTHLYSWDGTFFNPIHRLQDPDWIYGGKSVSIKISTDLLPRSDGWDVGLKARVYPEEAFDFAPNREELPITIPMWLKGIDISNPSGTIEPGCQEVVSIDISPQPEDSSSYEGKLAIVSNDPEHPEISVSIFLDIVVSAEDEIEIPMTYQLHQNYPNPFNPSTTIQYGLPEISDVSIAIYDIRGREVRSWQIKGQAAGWYDLKWSGTSRSGEQVSAGMYLARLQADGYSSTIKMISLK